MDLKIEERVNSILESFKPMKFGIELETQIDTRDMVKMSSDGTFPLVTSKHQNSVPYEGMCIRKEGNLVKYTEFLDLKDKEIYNLKICNDLLYGDNCGRDGLGLEVRFNPFTHDEHVAKTPDFNKVLDFLKKEGFQEWHAENAGIHIHTDREYWTWKELRIIIELVSSNKSFMEYFTDRHKRANYRGYFSALIPQDVTSTYSAKIEIFDTAGILNVFDSNSYVQKNTIMPKDEAYNLKIIGLRFNKPSRGNTLEFRIFNSVLDKTRFHSFVEFIIALKAYAMYRIASNSTEELTMQAFAEFTKTYLPHLTNLIDVLRYYAVLKTHINTNPKIILA